MEQECVGLVVSQLEGKHGLYVLKGPNLMHMMLILMN